MDDAITTIYECLQISEEKYLKNKAKLRDIRDEITKERQLGKVLKGEIESLEREISTLEKEVHKMEANKEVRNSKIKSVRSKLESVATECDQRKSRLDKEENILDEKIDDYMATVMNFHSRVGLHGKEKQSQPPTRDLSSSISLKEEDALKCELNVREDLLMEKSALEEQLKRLQMNLKSIDEARTKEKQSVLNKLKETIKIRNEISDPKKVKSIQKLEREILEMEQEIDFLKNAYEALQKEARTGNVPEKTKFQFKRNLLRKDEEFQPSKLSTPQIFKRNAPPVTPNASAIK